MFTTINEVHAHLHDWCDTYGVNPSELVVLGSAALMVHGLIDRCDDIDIEVSQDMIRELEAVSHCTFIESIQCNSMTYPQSSVEHIDKNLGRESDRIFGFDFPVATKAQLLADYQRFYAASPNEKYANRIKLLME